MGKRPVIADIRDVFSTELDVGQQAALTRAWNKWSSP
jgi:hypothetical protein